ncbi:KinB-signaling pathway activation protein [Phocicoccus pinnipedialis]|uniref:KinB-signaling pathway activation protein n=1 Tax=Phocicoccus pinnipedialis TaxID=110845 RepID=A0A6V7RAY9_9BACL|nr:KinB-signaling pathway activation protein [Jeotgalicoccus pinnipedialis]MBP1939905.1 KinB signaling pathway activation protein [Jeotgalicoccus pinnipedialis]CAD2074803.1 hypothetical protein JEOPIN946_00839 [Jeotgalicoccus pinnipedialis]
MSSKYLVKFYFVTLIIGAIASTFISLFTEYKNVTIHLFQLNIPEFLLGLVWIIGYGLLIATVSQVVFYIYLFINPLGLGIFRKFWPYVQLLLIMYAIFDLFYLRFTRLGTDHGTTLQFIWIPIIIVIVGFIVAYYKSKQTEGKGIFIPALFFMIFMTSLTLLPFISVEDTTWIYRSVFTVLILNAYQLLRLPNYIEDSKQDKLDRGVTSKALRNEKQRMEEERRSKKRKAKIDRQVKARNKLKYRNKSR